ncbi:hypothetical protein GCM10027570_46070 [Streptomonospora sediminis]
MPQFFVDDLVALLSAAAFLAAAIVLARNLLRARELRRTGTRVSGTIVALKWNRGGSDNSPMRNVVFDYETPNGRIVADQTWSSAAKDDFHEGQPITVAYDPASPDRAEIMDTESQLRGGLRMVAVMLVGSVLCVSFLFTT